MGKVMDRNMTIMTQRTMGKTPMIRAKALMIRGKGKAQAQAIKKNQQWIARSST
jgi:hypothetical protein